MALDITNTHSLSLSLSICVCVRNCHLVCMYIYIYVAFQCSLLFFIILDFKSPSILPSSPPSFPPDAPLGCTGITNMAFLTRNRFRTVHFKLDMVIPLTQYVTKWTRPSQKLCFLTILKYREYNLKKMNQSYSYSWRTTDCSFYLPSNPNPSYLDV